MILVLDIQNKDKKNSNIFNFYLLLVALVY